jgi:type II secretory pathway pseudopilin PulG
MHRTQSQLYVRQMVMAKRNVPLMTMVKRERYVAYTLIEILVVMATIGLLVAVLLPVMAKSRGAAKRAFCVNNLRQLYFAMLSYVDDHNDTLPYINWPANVGQPDWTMLLPYLDNNKEITRCPVKKGYYDDFPRVISYGYNALLSLQKLPLTDRSTVDTILFCDCKEGSFFYKDELDVDRHGKNLCQGIYIDGHAATINLNNFLDRPTCFLKGTRILMADGTTEPIDKLNTGDMIIAFDESTKEFKQDSVKQTFKVDGEKEYIVINNRIRVTLYHPFAIVVEEDIEWIKAKDLKIGYKMLNSQGKTEPITRIEKVRKSVTVYNLEINRYNTFIADNIIVHNKLTE